MRKWHQAKWRLCSRSYRHRTRLLPRSRVLPPESRKYTQGPGAGEGAGAGLGPGEGAGAEVMVVELKLKFWFWELL